MVVRSASIIPAAAPHELRRERLLELLHRQSARPLILLVAPAGFGKSTLAAAYARDSGAVVAWLTLHAGDRDSRAFFGRVRDVVQAAFGDPALLPELSKGLSEGAVGVGLARLFSADLAQAPAGFILVLDDYHVVQDADEVHESLDALVRGLPEMGQVLITARETPPLSMASLVASDGVFALGAEDLRFTSEEAAALRRVLGGDPAHDDSADGWVAGILLGGAPQQHGAGGGAVLGGYVEREVLRRLQWTEQGWLEALSVLEAITPGAAERLLGPGPWPARLAHLAERCPFLVPDEDGGYRLHALVRETLLERVRRNPARAERVWRLARALAEEGRDTAGFVRACQELGQTEEAVALVRKAAGEAMRSGRWAAALAALQLLPAAVRRAHPELCLVEAHALLQVSRPEQAHEAAEAALQLGGRSGDAVVQARAMAELASIGCYTGDLDAAEDWLAACEQLLLYGGIPPAVRRPTEGRARGLRGVCHAVRGQTAEAREELESAERLLAPGEPTRELAVVRWNLGTLCVRTGDYAAAERVLSSAASHLRLIGDRMALAAVQTLLGNVRLCTGRLEAAGSALSGALREARGVGAQRIEAHALASLGDWHRASGRICHAAASYEEALRLGEEVGEREPLVEWLRLRAEAAILQDDLPSARSLLARAQAAGQQVGSGFQMAGVERALGRLHLAEGALHRALNHFETALERGTQAWGPFERVTTLYWLGTANLSLGRAHPAEDALRQALEVAAPIGGVALVAGLAAEDPRLLRHGLQLGLDPATLGAAERLAVARQPWAGARPNTPLEVVARNQLPRLEVRLFGAFVVHRDGQLVDAEGRLDRVVEMLALLVLHPGGVPARDLAATMWPDMAPERAQQNLKMTAYRLRRLLASPPSVRFAGGAYQLAPQLELHADVRAFDEALAAVRKAVSENALQPLETAVAQYRGPLLAEVGWPWVEEFRLLYQQRFVEAALRLARALASADPTRSCDLAEQVLALDPLSEPAYEQLLRNHRARKDAAAVRTTQHRYRHATAGAGLQPNPALLAIAV